MGWATSTIKSLVPESHHDTVRIAGKRLAHYGGARYCLCCNSRVRRFTGYGQVQRAEARCPVCGALERHRLVSLFLQRNKARLKNPGALLHVAPEEIVAHQLRNLPGVTYVSADLFADAMTRCDVTELPFRESSLGALYCSHVLEHVPDDRQAMQEFYRVLRPGGWAILQVPIKGDFTREDPSITDPDERRRLFGQPDHVRVYGRDFGDRLCDAGFEVEVDRPAGAMPKDWTKRFGLVANEELFLCRKAA